MADRTPPMVCFVGRKNSGKTTMVTRCAAELTRRGRRVMTLKHGTHTFNLDPAGTDTYRHYHEGNVSRAAMVSPDKFAFVERLSAEPTPEAVAAQYLADADVVLCEGFKRSALPKLEVYRAVAHATPLYPEDAPDPKTWRAMISDAPVQAFGGTVFDLAAGEACIEAVCDWIEREIMA